MGRSANESRLAACCGRHPLFFAALVAAACVLVTPRGWPLALGLAALCGMAGGLLRNRLTGLAWLACGCLASGIYSVREAARTTAEQSLLASGGGEIHGQVLKDAKGKGELWSAPVALLDGPQPGARVWWQGRGECPVAGAIVTARGNFSPLPVMRNPGEFDQATWLRGLGVATVFQASWVTGTVTTGRWPALGAQIRRSFRTAVTTGLEENSQAAAVIRAVVIGELPPDAEELITAFRNSGTLHAFSVSGLHVAMVGTIAWCFLRLTGVPRRWAVLILLPLIFGYSWLTGNSPPAVRSAWMAAVFLGAFISRRRPDLLNALGAVLLFATLWDGRLLFQAGVQLSYGVVAAIALGASASLRRFAWLAQPELYLPPAFMTRRQKASLWLRQHLAQSLGVSLAAALGSTPLTAYHFGLVTPVSILAGVIFVPLVFVLLSASLLAVVLYPLVPAASQWVNRANAKVAETCVLTAEAFAAVPGGHFQIRQETEPFLLIYQLERGAAAACFSDGQGAAVLLDCGDPSSFKRRVAPSLQRLGVVPDSVVLSHPDGSHLGGGAAVWRRFPIRQVVLPVEKSRSPALQAWAEQAPATGIQTRLATHLQDLPLPAGARLEVIHAPSPQSLTAVADDRVAIYRLHWQGWKLLLTSDSGAATERAILLSQRDVSADVIIAGRHRTDTSLSDPFLDAVHPQAIIASHSEFPPAEKLAPLTLSYWESRSIQVISQALTGGVTLRIDPTGKLRIEGFADHSLILLSPR
jgi:competence protein ComEC